MKSTRHEWAISWEVDEQQVPVPALLHAAYRFIDRCYVAVEAAGESTIRVTLVARDQVAGAEAWARLVNDFEDQVAGEVLVQQVEANNIGTMEFVMAQALAETGDFGGAGKPNEDALDDPLGIAVSWEQRHERPAPVSPTDVPDERVGEAKDEPADERQ
jgi:His-Xaa-Ser system protein HxsD